MAMSKWQRKERLGHGAAQKIATLLELTRGHVAMVIRGDRRDARVEAVVAGMLGRPVDEVFEPKPSPESVGSAA